ncbi:hypothetical protein E2C01_087745 [Portunus trituberculatus]|uniref:Uncharacterized protein n=1 Tax=Portunus trituberculatus TaxID=210409 RepID=A0A5B7JK70_PORTR|nr:hypothetical protein [Portunus trituberculatus]
MWLGPPYKLTNFLPRVKSHRSFDQFWRQCRCAGLAQVWSADRGAGGAILASTDGREMRDKAPGIILFISLVEAGA